MSELHYVGLDVHKKIIAFCVKKQDGQIVAEGMLDSTRDALEKWARGRPQWVGGNGGDFVHWLDIRFSEAVFRRFEGGPSLNATCHFCG